MDLDSQPYEIEAEESDEESEASMDDDYAAHQESPSGSAEQPCIDADELTDEAADSESFSAPILAPSPVSSVYSELDGVLLDVIENTPPSEPAQAVPCYVPTASLLPPLAARPSSSADIDDEPVESRAIRRSRRTRKQVNLESEAMCIECGTVCLADSTIIQCISPGCGDWVRFNTLIIVIYSI